jgi:hypothetical protein
MRAARPHVRSSGSGITNGGEFQSRIFRAPAISSSPDAAL